MIIEDNLEELDTTATALKKGGYNVVKVSGIAKAEDLIKEENEDLPDCLIIDLNMSNEFLEENLKPQTHGGSLTGWVWLYNIAKPMLTNNPQIIIYSEFISELEEAINPKNEDEFNYYHSKSIFRTSKADAVNGSNHLVDEIKRLFEKK